MVNPRLKSLPGDVFFWEGFVRALPTLKLKEYKLDLPPIQVASGKLKV